MSRPGTAAAARTQFQSRLHETSGAEKRTKPNPTLQSSHTVVGAPPSSGKATAIVFLSPCPPGGVTPTRAQRLSGETLCKDMMSRFETATSPPPSSLISAEAARANDGVVGRGNGIEAKRIIRS